MAATLNAVAATDKRMINLEKDCSLLKAIRLAMVIAMLKMGICLSRKTNYVLDLVVFFLNMLTEHLFLHYEVFINPNHFTIYS